MAHISTLDYAMEAPQRHVGQPFPSPTRTPRFLLRGQGAVKASVDGAWFPWTTNVTAELHDLISALSLRLGRSRGLRSTGTRSAARSVVSTRSTDWKCGVRTLASPTI